MTNEEILPLVYIDENSIKVKSELHWLSKLSYNWSEVSKMKTNLSKTGESCFRLKLLNVIYTLQSYLSGLHGHLGQVFHAPFYFHDNSSGTILLIIQIGQK